MPGPVIISSLDANGIVTPAQADGNLVAVSTNGTRATFRYVAQDITPVATATDVLVLVGSATKVIRLTRVAVVGTATAASIYDFYLVKRTTANTAGTSTAQTASKADTNDSAQSGTLNLYTANPTALGTGTVLAASKLYLAAGATPNASTLEKEYLFGTRSDKQPVLRGVAESIAFNFNAQAVPAGASLYLLIEWTESDK